MSGRKPTSKKLASAESRFARFREVREGRARIPEALWSVAVELAAEEGMYRTARVLKLNSECLKKRVSAMSVSGDKRENLSTGFVELPFSDKASGEWVVEFDDRSKSRMSVRVKGAVMPDVAELARIFYGRKACSR